MANKKPVYEPDAFYRVRLSRIVKVGRFEYFPRDGLTFKGKTLIKISEGGDADAITSAKRI